MDWIDIPTIDATQSIYIINLPKASLAGNPLDEAINAVKHIVRTRPGPHTLMCSGGIDSQAMLYAWHMSGEKFEVLSALYNGFNEHDIISLQKFVEIHDIDVDVDYKNIDVCKFLETEFPEYSAKYRCSSPHICTYMKLAEMIETGTVIFSGNYISRPERSGTNISYAILGLKRFGDITGKSIIPSFFIYTPELAYSFIKFDNTSNNDGYLSKIISYQRAGFPVIPQSQKYTGFEKIKEYYDTLRDRVSTLTRVEFSSKPSKRIFDNLFRHPQEKQTKDPHLEFKFEFLEKDTK